MRQKDLDKIRDTALKAGWRIKTAGQTHEQWYSPDGVTILTVATKRHGGRGWQNLMAALKRAGLAI